MKVTSMKGRVVDMSALAAQNPDMVAIGQGDRMNARGDLIGRNGKVLKTRAEIANEYHQTNPKAVKNVSLKDMQSEVFQSPQDAVSSIEKVNKEQKAAKNAPRRKIEDSDD